MMAQRLTITVPDQLKEDLEPLRDSINISAICTAALQLEVDRRRAAVAVGAALTETVRRLRSGRKLADNTAEDAGLKIGQNWALQWATYDQIKVVAGLALGDEAQRLPGILATAGFPLGIDDQAASRRDPKAFWSGFARAVVEVWSKVKEAVENK